MSAKPPDRRAGLRELSRLTQDFGGYEAELKPTLTNSEIDVLERWYSEAGQLYGSEEHDQFIVALLENFFKLTKRARDANRMELALGIIASGLACKKAAPPEIRAFALKAMGEADAKR